MLLSPSLVSASTGGFYPSVCAFMRMNPSLVEGVRLPCLCCSVRIWELQPTPFLSAVTATSALISLTFNLKYLQLP